MEAQVPGVSNAQCLRQPACGLPCAHAQCCPCPMLLVPSAVPADVCQHPGLHGALSLPNVHSWLGNGVRVLGRFSHLRPQDSCAGPRSFEDAGQGLRDGGCWVTQCPLVQPLGNPRAWRWGGEATFICPFRLDVSEFSETEAHLTWGAQPLMQNCSEKPSQRVRGVGLPEGAGLPEGRGFPPSLRGILRKMRLAGAVWPHLGSGWRPLCGLVWISSWSARACGSGWPFAS